MSRELPMNAASVKAAKSVNGKATEYRIEGVQGFVLMVQPSGVGTYFFTYAKGSVRRRLKLGRREAMSLADARLAAVDAMANVSRENDPVADKQARREAMTINELIDAFMSAADGPSQATKENYKFCLVDIRKAIGTKPATEVTADDIADVIDVIVDRNSISQADHAKSAISSVINWGIKSRRAKGLRVNVCKTLPKRGTTQSRSRGIADGELATLWLALDNVTEPVAIAARLAWLTASRRSEVVGARVAELDLDNARWTIPGDTLSKGRLVEGRTKSGREKVVPLSTHSIAMFRRAMKLAGEKSVYVFPSDVKDGKFPHLAPLSVTTAVRRVRGDSDVRLHDGRAAARTWLRDQGFAENVLDGALGHSGRSVGDKHYTASSLVFVERQMRPALQSWSDHVVGVVELARDSTKSSCCIVNNDAT